MVRLGFPGCFCPGIMILRAFTAASFAKGLDLGMARFIITGGRGDYEPDRRPLKTAARLRDLFVRQGWFEHSVLAAASSVEVSS